MKHLIKTTRITNIKFVRTCCIKYVDVYNTLWNPFKLNPLVHNRYFYERCVLRCTVLKEKWFYISLLNIQLKLL